MDELVIPLQEKKSLFEKIKRHKTPVILASIGFLILFSMTLYLLSPARNSLFAPATDENLTIPNLIPTRVPTATPSPTPIFTATPVSTAKTASWKPYINSIYSYSIKYSPDWTVKDLGILEPKIPSYIVFNTSSASSSARYITISVSTRTYEEQLALAASGSAITVAGIKGTRQDFRDSDGNTSTVVTLPRDNNLLVFRAKSAYISILNLMLTTLKITN